MNVQTGEDDGPHSVGANSEPWRSRLDFLLQCNVENYRQLELRVPATEVTGFIGGGILRAVMEG